jgi:DNA polymerase III alpha subunit
MTKEQELKIELQDRTLFFNGVTEAKNPNDTYKFLLLGIKPSQISTTEITGDIAHHNALVESTEDEIKKSPSDLEIAASITPEVYQIPQKYLDIDLRDYALSKLRDYPTERQAQAKERIETELVEIEKRNIGNLFRTIIYMMDVLDSKQIVYGVGRGSSCACFMLFLFGLNLLDPIEFDIPIEEFFH